MKKVEVQNPNQPVRIHNELASGRGDFSACMLDILFFILSDLKQGERFYTIRAKDISEITGREWNYQQFREATELMGSRMFEIELREDKNRPKKTTGLLQLWLFSSVQYIHGSGSFEVELSQKALPYLFDLKKNFTSMQLKSLLMCSSKYAKRLYMLGCQWRGAGKAPQMTIDELKILLGLKDPKGKKKEKYSRFSQFKQQVLDTAKIQINNETDIIIDYKLHKRGRSYYWIDIFINYQAGHQLQIQFDKPIEVQKATQTIMLYGFSEKQAVAMAKMGLTVFEKHRNKVKDKINSGEMTSEKFVPYMIGIYQKMGVLVRVDE